jgi:hypothetical protein
MDTFLEVVEPDAWAAGLLDGQRVTRIASAVSGSPERRADY